MFVYVSHCSGNLPESSLRELVRLMGRGHEEIKPLLPVIRAELRKRGFDVCSKIVGFQQPEDTTSDQLRDVLYHLTGGETGDNASITMLGKFELVEADDEMDSMLAFAGNGHSFSRFVRHNDEVVAVCTECAVEGRNVEIRFQGSETVTIPRKRCNYAKDAKAA